MRTFQHSFLESLSSHSPEKAINTSKITDSNLQKISIEPIMWKHPVENCKYLKYGGSEKGQEREVVQGEELESLLPIYNKGNSVKSKLESVFQSWA